MSHIGYKVLEKQRYLSSKTSLSPGEAEQEQRGRKTKLHSGCKMLTKVLLKDGAQERGGKDVDGYSKAKALRHEGMAAWKSNMPEALGSRV